ncbi:PEP-CTERM sorting domain-containing protein [Thauera sinica]|uniref:PEP-CTERM sorting domain-containing protein n=1 Tax=Thauera sinica TaxID=2665146 RepID=A0ABW1ANE7_9RHOO|nr:PEP-CTERM sorting domain-containing protein [Thauera sp. K11]ATE60515.1 PEP-CTERM sorting domain-containing protein [Thauera sp. K11]
MNFKSLLAAAALTAVMAVPAQAAIVNDASSFGHAVVATFDDFDGLITTGPVTVAPGVTFTGTESVLGASIADLGSNGIWYDDGGDRFAGTGSPDSVGFGLLHFTFDTALTRAAGAFLNSFNGGPILIAAYGANGRILETHFITIDTDAGSFNDGRFFGISRATADIRSIAFGGIGLVADDLTFAASVPEPESYAMLLAGLGMLGFVARRRSRN